MIILGIDVGVTGAIAALRDDGAFQDVRDLPIMVTGKAKWVDAMEMLHIVRDMRNGSEAVAFVERVHAMPMMGSVASNSKGMTLGSTLAALQIAGVAIELVEPGVWKRAMSLTAPKGTTDREKKLASLTRARMLFPAAPLTRVGDNNRAEALLIASYGQRFRQGRPEVAA
jgi:hypothetical protein